MEESPELKIAAGRALAMNFFKQAEFNRRITRISEDEFEQLCRDTRKLVSDSLSVHNKQARKVTKEVEQTLHSTVLWGRSVDITTVMRYVSEIEEDLRQLRKKARP